MLDIPEVRQALVDYACPGAPAREVSWPSPSFQRKPLGTFTSSHGGLLPSHELIKAARGRAFNPRSLDRSALYC